MQLKLHMAICVCVAVGASPFDVYIIIIALHNTYILYMLCSGVLYICS